MIRLALTPQLAHFAYNNGGDCVSGHELAAAVRHWLPDAKIDFDESKPTTPLIDWQEWPAIGKRNPVQAAPTAGRRARHINQARLEAGLQPV